jgi:cbb3-type cytochrome c oxidase subunit III
MTFRKLSVLLLVFALLGGIGLIVMGQTSPIMHQDTRVSAAKAKNVKKLFKQNCVKCHGADGAGETTFGQIAGAADFTDSDWQKRVDDQRLVNSITYGRGQMPSFDKKFSKEQIKSLVSYVRAFKN